jgi:hypothetical protein
VTEQINGLIEGNVMNGFGSLRETVLDVIAAIVAATGAGLLAWNHGPRRGRWAVVAAAVVATLGATLVAPRLVLEVSASALGAHRALRVRWRWVTRLTARHRAAKCVMAGLGLVVGLWVGALAVAAPLFTAGLAIVAWALYRSARCSGRQLRRFIAYLRAQTPGS